MANALLAKGQFRQLGRRERFNLGHIRGVGQHAFGHTYRQRRSTCSRLGGLAKLADAQG